MELAEYAVANKLVEEPAFVWWVRPVLRRRDRILKKVKSRYWAKTHKYGIELPKSVAAALAVDRKTGTDFWMNAMINDLRQEGITPTFGIDLAKEIICSQVCSEYLSRSIGKFDLTLVRAE